MFFLFFHVVINHCVQMIQKILLIFNYIHSETWHHAILRNNEMLKGSRLFRYQIIYRTYYSLFLYIIILNAIFSFFTVSLLEQISSLFISCLMDLRHLVGKRSNEILFHSNRKGSEKKKKNRKIIEV